MGHCKTLKPKTQNLGKLSSLLSGRISGFEFFFSSNMNPLFDGRKLRPGVKQVPILDYEASKKEGFMVYISKYEDELSEDDKNSLEKTGRIRMKE